MSRGAGYPLRVRRTASRRSLDLHSTCPEAVWALLECEDVPAKLVEPACGRGALVRVLEAAGRDVLASDVRLWRGAPEGARRIDFLSDPLPAGWRRGRALVTNPPYSVAARFAERAVREFSWVALLLRLGFLEGGTRGDRDALARAFVLDERPPARVHVFKRRLPMMHRDGWRGPLADSAIVHAWYVWDGPVRRGESRWNRIDWRPLATNR